jgi:two-component sensor histidine kinase
MMPRLDGYGLVERLRSHPQTSSVPIILLSARAGEQSRVEGLQHGADDYVTKPFNARELLARVQTALDLQRLRREADEAMRKSLVEKEELLREVHHRVKNNLQVITSLINLQARQVEDERVLALFDETRNRVYAISAIHELLCRSTSFASIDLAGYARHLGPELVRFYGVESRVRITVKGDGVSLELERSVPYGLLLNEAISNACKHAFPAGRSGTITISLGLEGETITLIVEDDGVGLPVNFDAEGATSLGMRLIHMLAKQLGGQVQVTPGPGARVELRFPASRDQDEQL